MKITIKKRENSKIFNTFTKSLIPFEWADTDIGIAQEQKADFITFLWIKINFLAKINKKNNCARRIAEKLIHFR